MNRIMKKLYLIVLMVSVILLTWAVSGHGQPVTGDIAPAFTLEDISGKKLDLAEMNEQPMLILYFFDAESKPSQQGLLDIDQLVKQYREANIAVWGITMSPKETANSFFEVTKPGFPVLLDDSAVSDLYSAKLVLPTICVLGPNLKVLDYFQGGGKTTEIMLVRIAERQLQRKQNGLAKAISEKVIKQNPENIEAKAIKGYASLNEGDLEGANSIFDELSRQPGKGVAVGLEGMAAIHVQKGETDKALEIAADVIKKAPDRAYAHVIKGNVLYSQNKKKEAEAEYEKAIGKNIAPSFQRAIAYNQFGRLKANQGKYEKSRDLYDQAIAIDPYYVEATSNKGLTYEKEGKWDKALDTYRQALTIDKNDTFSAILAKKAEDMLTMQSDVEKKKRIDSLVKELADRFKSQKDTWLKKEDTWTSRPMVMTFVDFQEKGGLSERDGFSIVLTSQLGNELNSSGRVQVVERVLLERLLEELNLGASDLADPETALRLGNVLAAKVIGTGTIYYVPDGTLLSLRFIDTETSAIPKVITRQVPTSASLDKEILRLNREILKTIILKYPLQGYVVQSTADEVMVNVGSEQGVVLGAKFDVIEEQEAIQYKGKTLRGLPKVVGQIEVVRVEPSLSYAKIVKQERFLKTDDKIKEKIDPAVTMR